MVKKYIPNDDPYLQMGKKLNELRKKENLSITELSETLDLSTKIISNYENGWNRMTLETILSIYESDFANDYDLDTLTQIFIVDIFE